MSDLSPHNFVKHLARYLDDDGVIACHYRREFGREISTRRIAEIRNVYWRDKPGSVEALDCDDKYLSAMGIIHGNPPSREVLCRLAVERANIRAVVEAEKAIRAICKLTDVTRNEFLAANRLRYVATLRYAVAYHLRGRGISYPKIARAIGRKDHTTAIHAVLTASDLIDRDDEFKALVEDLNTAVTRGEGA